MHRTVDAANFTGQTLAWFEEGEELAASERDTAAERVAGRHPLRTALMVVMFFALVGAGAVLVAQQLGWTIDDLPWDVSSLPWA